MLRMNLAKFFGDGGGMGRYEECRGLILQGNTEDVADAFLLGTNYLRDKARLFIIRDGEQDEYADLLREISGFTATGGMGA